MEGMLVGQVKADESLIDQKLEEQDEYDDQVVGRVDSEKPQQSKRPENMGMCVLLYY